MKPKLPVNHSLYKSYVDRTNKGFITGTVGATGPQGPIGPPGPTGPKGLIGERGDDGITPDISSKVDKITGMGLSSNDYTDADKAKVDAGIGGTGNAYFPAGW